MSHENASGGSVVGWCFGLIGAGFGMASLYYSVTAWETHSVAGVCLLVYAVFYRLARRQVR